MICSSRFSIRIADIYFDEPKPCSVNVDILRYNQTAAPVRGAVCTPFPTLLIDLSVSPDQLLANMKRECREKIRRAERDEAAGNLVYEFSTTGDQEMLTRFGNHFDRCAAAKALPHVSRERLSILARHRALDTSFVSDPSGEILAASTSVLTPRRVRGLYAAASFRFTADQRRRSFIGRANRYLYWRDLLRFRESGAELFDFGGFYTGNSDHEKLQINQFKSSFGGKLQTEFNCEECVTLKGRLARWAIQQRNSWAWRRHRHHTLARVHEHTCGNKNEGTVPTSV
jgi:hypothetical protein